MHTRCKAPGQGGGAALRGDGWLGQRFTFPRSHLRGLRAACAALQASIGENENAPEKKRRRLRGIKCDPGAFQGGSVHNGFKYAPKTRFTAVQSDDWRFLRFAQFRNKNLNAKHAAQLLQCAACAQRGRAPGVACYWWSSPHLWGQESDFQGVL